MSAPERPDRAEAVDRMYRLLTLIGILGVFIAVLLLADRSTRPEVIGWEGGFVTAAIVLAVWNRVPERPRPASRFTRSQLMSATFMVICLAGGAIVPDILEHKTSTWNWVVLPLLLGALFAGFVVAERRDDDRVDQDLAEWRRARPHVRPKSR
jgi:Na+/glutamate symporter